MSLLDWTGHPLVDVGIATLCAMTDRPGPKGLTLEDLDAAAAEMYRYYFSGVMNSYLTCVFMNSEYVQPGSGSVKEKSRKAYAERVLYAHRAKGELEGSGLTCTFSARPATHMIHRGQMPMLTGEGVLNFFPHGTGGMPIAGPYLTAVQALPLGGRRAEGKMLIAYSDDDLLTLEFARKYLDDNRRLINLSTQNQLPDEEGPHISLEREHASWDATKKRAKFPDAKAAPTLVTKDLLDVLAARGQRQKFEARRASVMVYWLSSSGQGPSLQTFELPGNLVAFLDDVRKASTKEAWNAIIARGWPQAENDAAGSPKRSRKKPKAPVPLDRPGISRNEALDDLFRIFSAGAPNAKAAQNFLRKRILPALKATGSGDTYWRLTELFIKELLGMDQEHIDAIKAFSDKLAEHVHRKRNKKLLYTLLYEKNAWEFRNALVKTHRNEFRFNNDLLFGLEEYLKVFVRSDGDGSADWYVVRDLISIRLVERLHALGADPAEVPNEDQAPEEEEVA